QGNDVSIHAHGAIEDARASNDTRANVQAKRLTLRGDLGVGTRTDMALDVSYLSASGGVGGVKAKNASAIEVDAASLENKGASGVTIVATHVTILDAQGNLIIMNGGNLYLEATDGNIVFLDQQDTIELQGGGSITLKARSESGRDGYKGAIITGNLTTQGGDITVDAESNATISRLDTGGTGDVWVESKHGLILDGNGVSENIRADKATLISSAPNFREAELTRDTAIAEYAAKVAEANAKKLTLDLMEQQLNAYTIQLANALTQMNIASYNEQTMEWQVNSASASVEQARARVDTLNSVLKAATLVRNAAAVIAGFAQAVPFSGDAGADATFAVVDLAMSAADLALDNYERYTLAPREDRLDDLNNQLDVAIANHVDAMTNVNMATVLKET